jgi:hypothetical protein
MPSATLMASANSRFADRRRKNGDGEQVGDRVRRPPHDDRERQRGHGLKSRIARTAAPGLIRHLPDPEVDKHSSGDCGRSSAFLTLGAPTN